MEQFCKGGRSQRFAETVPWALCLKPFWQQGFLYVVMPCPFSPCSSTVEVNACSKFNASRPSKSSPASAWDASLIVFVGLIPFPPPGSPLWSPSPAGESCCMLPQRLRAVCGRALPAQCLRWLLCDSSASAARLEAPGQQDSSFLALCTMNTWYMVVCHRSQWLCAEGWIISWLGVLGAVATGYIFLSGWWGFIRLFVWTNLCSSGSSSVWESEQGLGKNILLH